MNKFMKAAGETAIAFAKRTIWGSGHEVVFPSADEMVAAQRLVDQDSADHAAKRGPTLEQQRLVRRLANGTPDLALAKSAPVAAAPLSNSEETELAIKRFKLANHQAI